MISKTTKRIYRISIAFISGGIFFVFAVPTMNLLLGRNNTKSFLMLLYGSLFLLMLTLLFLIWDVIKISFYQNIPRHLHTHYGKLFGIFCFGYLLFSCFIFYLFDYAFIIGEEIIGLTSLFLIVIFLVTNGIPLFELPYDYPDDDDDEGNTPDKPDPITGKSKNLPVQKRKTPKRLKILETLEERMRISDDIRDN